MTTTFAPSRPSRRAIAYGRATLNARPIPRDEPVTIATFPERDTIIYLLDF
ncbi:hypothetical protein [Brasilonema sp. UFV-L1]|uniref:hypothetical protein n=1 Tax=Brasilonema sp. UFV-L1 TaxID=2234130 RepID=UPI0030D7A2BC